MSRHIVSGNFKQNLILAVASGDVDLKCITQFSSAEREGEKDSVCVCVCQYAQ